MNEVMKCASFFAGVGGIDLGFEMTGKFRTVYANEADPYPASVFEGNSSVMADCRDIRKVSPDDIPDFDVMLAGFPCQAFSIAGKKEGFADSMGRGTLYLELVRILEAKKPSALLFENVKNLVSHDKGRSFAVIVSSLENLGYHVRHKIMNAAEYGNVPQNRERVYIAGFRDAETAERFSFPEPVPLTTPVSAVIDFQNPVPEKYYYRRGKNRNGLCEKIEAGIPEQEGAYQWRGYVRSCGRGLIPALTAHMGTGGNNVSIVRTAHDIRKMTPRECFRAQGFPDSFILPESVSDSRLYKAAGNSVCVPVIRRIAEKVAEAMK